MKVLDKNKVKEVSGGGYRPSPITDYSDPGSYFQAYDPDEYYGYYGLK